ncbi:hypothetical protein C2E31_23085, partial [Rhodopirellula baltica]
DLIRRWIEGGSPIDRMNDDSMNWEPIPESIRTSLALAVSPDAHSLAVAHANRVNVVNIPDRQSITQLVDPGLAQPGVASLDFVGAIAYSPLGQRLATGGFKTVRLWQRVPGQVQPWQWSMPIGGMTVLSPDQSRLAFVDTIGDVQLWSIDQQQHLATIAVPNKASLINWNAANQIAIVDRSKTLRYIDVETRQEKASYLLESNVRQLSCSADGGLAAVVQGDGRVRLFDQTQGIEKQSVSSLEDVTVAFATTANALWVGTRSGNVQHIDLNSDKVSQSFANGSPVSTIAVGQERLYVGSESGEIKTFNRAESQLVSTSSGDWQIRLQQQTLQHQLKQQADWTEHLKKQSETLKANVEKEQKSLDEAQKAHDEAKKKLETDRQQRDEVKLQLEVANVNKATLEESIAKNKSADETLQQSIASIDQQTESMTQSMTSLRQKSVAANEQVKDAESKLAEAMKQLQEAKDLAAKELATLQASEKELAEKQQLREQQTAERKELESKRAESEKQLADQTKQIEQHQKTLGERAKTVATSEQTLANKSQALEATKEAHKVAAEKVPAQQREILVRSLRVDSIKQDLEQIGNTGASTQPVVSIRESLSNNTIVVLDAAGKLRRFDVASGQPLGPAISIGFESVTKQTQLANIGNSWCVLGRFTPRTIQLDERWKLQSVIGGLQSELISDRVMALAFSPDGTMVALGSGVPSRSGMVAIADTSTGEVVRQFDGIHSDSVLTLRFSPSGDLLASGSADKSIRLIDFRQSRVIKSLDGHTHHVLALDWKRDGRMLVSGGADKNIKLWDVESGQQQRNIGPLSEEVTAVRYLADSNRVASTTLDGQIRIHDTGNGNQVSAAGAGQLLYALDITDNGEFLSVSGEQGDVSVWRTDGLQRITNP